jgi:hypothetical protein
MLHTGLTKCCTSASRRRRAFQRPQCSTRGGQTAAQVPAEEDGPCRGPSAPHGEGKLLHESQQRKTGLPEAPVLHSGRTNCCTSASRRRWAMQRPQCSTRGGQTAAQVPQMKAGHAKALVLTRGGKTAAQVPQRKTGHAEAPALHSGRTKLRHKYKQKKTGHAEASPLGEETAAHMPAEEDGPSRGPNPPLGRKNCCTSAAEEDGPCRGPRLSTRGGKTAAQVPQKKTGLPEAPMLHSGRTNCGTSASRRRWAMQRPQCSTRGGQTAARKPAEEDGPSRGPSAPLGEDKLLHKC